MLNFSDHEIITSKMNELAAKSGITKDAFSHQFRKQYGIPFKFYRQQLLIEKINELLIEYNGDIHPIAEILRRKFVSVFNYVTKLKKEKKLNFAAETAFNNAIRSYQKKKYNVLISEDLNEMIFKLKEIRADINRLYNQGIFFGPKLKDLNQQDYFLTNYLINRLGIEKFLEKYLQVQIFTMPIIRHEMRENYARAN